MYRKRTTESFLKDYNGSLSRALNYDGTMCNGYSGIKNINIHPNKCNRFWLVHNAVRKWVIKAAL